MEKVVTIKEASLATMSVELTAIKVNNKQMSLSIFRQIKREPYLDRETLEERGVLWGSVNYYWGGEDKYIDCGKIHILWQKSDELRRDIIYKLKNLKYFVEECTRDKAKQIMNLKSFLVGTADYETSCFLFAKYDILDNHFLNKKRLAQIIERNDNSYKAEYIEKSKQIHARIEQDILALEKKLEKEKIMYTDYHNNFMKIYNKLQNLPQLYIAA